MLEVTYLIAGIVVGAAFGYWFGKLSAGRVEHTKIINTKQVAEKRQNLEKILRMVEAHGEVTNDMVEKSLEVSNATAERYLQELEEQGKLKQIGELGRPVKYTLK